jgi:hypothetical protein
MKSAWVRTASSVQTWSVCRLKNNRTHRHVCTPEAMRTQALSEERNWKRRREMTFRIGLFGTLLLSMCLVSLGADKANFSGVWIMDKSKSEGLPPNMDQKMRVTQEGDKLELETELFVDDNVNAIHDAYLINGQAAEFTARFREFETKGKRVAKWSEDGRGLEVNEEAVYDTSEGKITTTMRRKWALSADGKTVVIELNFQGPNGPIASRRTFNRKS